MSDEVILSEFPSPADFIQNFTIKTDREIAINLLLTTYPDIPRENILKDYTTFTYSNNTVGYAGKIDPSSSPHTYDIRLDNERRYKYSPGKYQQNYLVRYTPIPSKELIEKIFAPFLGKTFQYELKENDGIYRHFVNKLGTVVGGMIGNIFKEVVISKDESYIFFMTNLPYVFNPHPRQMVTITTEYFLANKERCLRDFVWMRMLRKVPSQDELYTMPKKSTVVTSIDPNIVYTF